MKINFKIQGIQGNQGHLGTLTKGTFTLAGIPDGIPRGIALVQSAHFYLFLRDTQAVLRPIASRAIP